MGMGVYFGINSVARKVSKVYFGVNNVAKQVTKGYKGISNVARQFYASDSIIWEPGATASDIFQGIRVNGFGLVKEYKWQSAGNVSNSGNNLVVKGNSGTYSSVFSINKINLSSYTKATIVVAALDNGSNGGEIRAGFTTSNADRYTGTYKTISKGTITIDISSLSGSHYLAFAIVGGTKITISSITLE